jgi:hypothetical protein
VLDLPDAEYLHVHLARGAAELTVADGPVALRAGDAARLRAAGRPTLTASTDAELLVWEMHEGLGG